MSERQLFLGFSHPNTCTIMGFYSVGDDVGALARGWWGIHAESANTSTVHGRVRAIG